MRLHIRLLPGLAAIMLLPAAVMGRQASPPGKLRVEVDGGWLVAHVGTEDAGQVVRVAIWGSLRDSTFFEAGYRQLDDDADLEYVVISRNPGSGPYYALQILNVLPDGLASRLYHSDGRPRISGRQIELGKLTNGYQGAASQPVYTRYQLGPRGLAPVRQP